jgi:hypothetical protein
MPLCPSCREMVSGKPEQVGARCPYCREPLFEPGGAAERAPGPEDGRCAEHPDSAAVGTCVRCGNYLCPVCQTRWREQALCIACVDRALENQEQTPEEARAHKRQALLALFFGLGAWGMVVLGLLVLGVGVLLQSANECGGAVLLIVGAIVFLGSPLLSVQGIGQGAAAIRTRGKHMILATAGLLISALHLGLLIGLLSSNLWQM